MEWTRLYYHRSMVFYGQFFTFFEGRQTTLDNIIWSDLYKRYTVNCDQRDYLLLYVMVTCATVYNIINPLPVKFWIYLISLLF